MSLSTSRPARTGATDPQQRECLYRRIISDLCIALTAVTAGADTCLAQQAVERAQRSLRKLDQ